MPYMGNNPIFGSYAVQLLSGNGVLTSFTLTHAPASSTTLLVTISGVKQQAGAYSVTDTTIDFGAGNAPPSGTNNIEVLYLGQRVDVGTVGDDTIATAKIADNAVTPAKMADSAFLASRNILINGNMLIAQRGTGTVDPTTNGFPVDRWKAYTSTGSGHTIQQVSDSPAGFEHSIKTIIGTGASPAAANINVVYQSIEGYNVSHLDFGTSAALSIVASFWVKSSIAGNYGCSIHNQALNRGYPGQYTVSAANTWEKKTVTFTGDTTGTWLKTNGIGMHINFDLGSGTDYQGTLDTWGAGNYKRVSGQVILIATSAATIQFSGAQLEIGTAATPFEQKTFGQELAACQRYYQKTFNYATAPANGAGHTWAGAFLWDTRITTLSPSVNWQYAVQMRAAPTVTLYNTRTGGTAGQWTTGGSDGANARALTANDTTVSIDNTGTTLGAASWGIHATAESEL